MVRRQLSQVFGAEPNAESVDGRAGWRGPTVPQNQPVCRCEFEIEIKTNWQETRPGGHGQNLKGSGPSSASTRLEFHKSCNPMKR